MQEVATREVPPGWAPLRNRWHNGVMTPRVLVVCTGNICRSPMGEIVLKEAAAAAGLDVVVHSAGVSGEEEGNPIDRRARRVLDSAGYPVHDHRAHQVRPGELEDYDLVLAMTSQHLGALHRRADRDGADPSRLRLWREFDPAAPRSADDTCLRDLDIPDPWYGGHQDFVDTLAALEAGTDRILAHLRELANR